MSRVGGREGDSYITKAQQRDAIERWCGLQGYEVAQWHEEEDRSGGDKTRPKWNEVIRRALEGETDGVICAKLDRFARSAIDGLKAVTSLEEAGKTFVSVAEKFDTADPYGRFAATIFFALAELELGRIREGWQDAKARARARGVHIGVARAGYVRNGEGKLEEHPEHLAAVKRAYALRARGGTWRETADLLTGAGVTTSRGSTRWSRQATRNLIENRAYRGEAVPAWQWEKGQPKQGAPRVRGEGYLLGQGLVRCGACGDVMCRSSSHGGKYQTLRCNSSGKGHAAISYPLAEDWILGVAFKRLGSRVKSRPGGDDGTELRQALEAAQAELAEVEELLGTSAPPACRQRLAVEQAEAALAEFEAEQERPLGPEDILSPLGVRQEVQKLPLPEQRRILRQIVSKAVVEPGRAHVGQRIVIEFTDGSWHPADAEPGWDWKEHSPDLPLLAQVN